MARIVLAVGFIIVAVVLTKFVSKPKQAPEGGEADKNLPAILLTSKWKLVRAAQALSIFMAFFLMLSTSYVIIDADRIGQLTKIYLGTSMPPGQIIAFDGEKGPQAEILPPKPLPGTHEKASTRTPTV